MLKNKVIIPLTALMILSICSITSCNNNTSSSSSSSSNTSSVVELNYLALTRRIEYVKNNYLTEEKKSLYTAESIKILENAVKEGESLINNAKTQQEIDDAVIKINNAIDNLISNINPDKTLDEIGEFLDNCNGNYTLKVNDYYKNNNETPISYTIKSTDKAIYDVEKNEGFIKFDGYVHNFNYVDNNFSLGRVHLGESQSPALYLTENRLSDVVSQLGVSEPFTSFGLSVYSGFKQVPGQKYYITDSTTYFDLTLDLINNRYQSYDGFNGLLQSMTLELTNDNVLFMRLYGNDLTDLKFELEFSSFNTTSIDGVDEYLANNTEYNTSFSPMDLAKDMVEKSKTSCGLKFNVFSHKEGKSTQNPNYTITYKNTAQNEYWLSSSNNGIIKSGSSYKNFKYENDTATINDDAAYGIKDIDIINKLLVNYNEFTLLNKTDDYYFNVGENPEIQQMLYRFFELSNYQNVADRNYFNDEPSKIKTSDIQKVSLTKNDEGKLVISLFSELSSGKDGLIIRAVLEDYQNVTIDGLEDLTSANKKQLQDFYTSIKDADQEKYTEKSYHAFKVTLDKAQEILNDQTSDINTYIQMLSVLKNSYSELELKTSSFDEDGESKIKTFLNENSSYSTSYKMEVTSNNKTLTYIAKYNKYFYCLETKTGYVMIDNFVHSFHVKNDKIVIDNLYSNEYGAHANQIARVQKYFGNFESLAGIEDWEELSGSYMTRLSNSNKYFTTNVDYLNFVPNINTDNLCGFSLELLENNNFELELYNSTSLNMKIDNANSYELASLNKGSVNTTVKITNLKNATDDLLEAFINSNDAVFTKDEILNKLKDFPQTYVIKNDDGDIALVSDRYYLDLETNQFYAVIEGKVNKYQFNPNFIADGTDPYKLLEAGIKVNGVEATSIAQITGTLNGLKSLTENDITLPIDEDTNLNTKRYYYELNSEKTGDIVKILDIDSDSLGSLCVSYNSKGEIVIVNYESDYYIESYYTLSTEYDEMTDIMLNNIISMLNNEF